MKEFRYSTDESIGDYELMLLARLSVSLLSSLATEIEVGRSRRKRHSRLVF